MVRPSLQLIQEPIECLAIVLGQNDHELMLHLSDDLFYLGIDPLPSRRKSYNHSPAIARVRISSRQTLFRKAIDNPRNFVHLQRGVRIDL